MSRVYSEDECACSEQATLYMVLEFTNFLIILDFDIMIFSQYLKRKGKSLIVDQKGDIVKDPMKSGGVCHAGVGWVM